jgi:hypothetical protein
MSPQSSPLFSEFPFAIFGTALIERYLLKFGHYHDIDLLTASSTMFSLMIHFPSSLCAIQNLLQLDIDFAPF